MSRVIKVAAFYDSASFIFSWLCDKGNIDVIWKLEFFPVNRGNKKSQIQISREFKFYSQSFGQNYLNPSYQTYTDNSSYQSHYINSNQLHV